jgi:hypothetical protein
MVLTLIVFGDWSFRHIFDRTITRSCAVAASSKVSVYAPFGDPYDLSPLVESKAQTGITVFNLLDRLLEFTLLDGCDPDESQFKTVLTCH